MYVLKINRTARSRYNYHHHIHHHQHHYHQHHYHHHIHQHHIHHHHHYQQNRQITTIITPPPTLHPPPVPPTLHHNQQHILTTYMYEPVFIVAFAIRHQVLVPRCRLERLTEVPKIACSISLWDLMYISFSCLAYLNFVGQPKPWYCITHYYLSR